MSSFEVDYPVEVKQYQVSIAQDSIRITLEGIEALVSEQQSNAINANLKIVGRMTFSNPDPIDNRDTMTRDGVLKMDRPLVMFPGILNMLQHQKPLFLHKDGTLSTALDFIYRIRA